MADAALTAAIAAAVQTARFDFDAAVEVLRAQQ